MTKKIQMIKDEAILVDIELADNVFGERFYIANDEGIVIPANFTNRKAKVNKFVAKKLFEEGIIKQPEIPLD